MSMASRSLGRGAAMAAGFGRNLDAVSSLRGFALASAVGVLAMGLIVLVSWHGRMLDAFDSSPLLAPIPYNSAVAFAASGLALLLVVIERLRLARATALLVLVLGAVTCARYAFAWDAGVLAWLLPDVIRDTPYAFHMAPMTAVGFLLAGTGLWLLAVPVPSSRRMAVGGLVANVLFALGVVPVVGYLANLDAASSWRELTMMSGLSAAGFTGLAPGVFTMAVLNDPERPRGGLHWLPLAVATGLSALAVVLWLALKVEHREGLRDSAEVEARAAAHDVQSALDRRMESVQRMARRWEVRGGMPRDEWTDDAIQYAAHLAGLVVMGWADADGRTRWLVPAGGASRGAGYRHHLQAFQALGGGAAAAPGITTDTEHRGGATLALHTPLVVDGQPQGTISALHDARAFFDGVLENRILQSLRVAVLDEEGRALYGNAADAAGATPIAGRQTFTVAGQSWQLVAVPMPAFLVERGTLLPTLVLFVGILLAALVASCVRLVQVANQRKASLAALNQGLEARISARTAELEQAQRELERAYDTERWGRRRLRFLLDSLAEGIYAVDADGNCTYCNTACQHMLGYGWREMVGRNVHQLIHHTRPDGTPYPAEECRVYQSIFHGDGARAANELLWRADGSSFQAEYWSLPIRDDDGKLVAGLVTFFDVSERRQAQERLEQRYRQQSAVAELGMAALGGGAGSLVQKAAEVAAETLDVEFAKVLELLPGGRELRLLAGVGWEPGAVGEVLLETGSRSQGGYTLTVNEPVVVTDLSTETRFTSVPLLLRHGVVSGVSTIIHGRQGPWGVLGVHTSRRRQFDEADVAFLQSVANLIGYALQGAEAAAEIRALNEELEQRVRQRTAELEAANRELEGFSYSVSHDLRSPLRAIDGFAEMLLEDHAEHLDDEGRRVLGVIQRNVGKMGRLIDELLQFSRLSRRELTRSPVDMTALAREVADELLQQEGERRFRLRIEELPGAVGDPLLLRQVWTNLIGNALKYTRGCDPVHIVISGESRGDRASYAVADNGVGFDMVYADKLFGVFQRLHRESEFEGTGVGLALVQRILARHGGAIEGKGAPGAGATFTFTLPAGKQS